jgi:dTDP-4-amino-4,6-dideoxygalactose transaminase
MTYYREKYGYAEGKYINAAILSDRSIALPVGPHLNEEHMIFIANTLIETLNSL